MAFPFPDANHGSDACVVRYERDTACIDPWRDEERKVAIMLLIVPLAVFLWKVRLGIHLRIYNICNANPRLDRHRVDPVLAIIMAAFSFQTAKRYKS